MGCGAKPHGFKDRDKNMNIVDNFGKIQNGTAITIGKFEAIHLGHKMLIESAREEAKKHGLECSILSFVPHPIKILADYHYKPLYTQDEQLFLLKNSVDNWIKFPFTAETANQDPADFCKILCEKFSCKLIIVGEGFRFGRGRSGTAQNLLEIAANLGIKAAIIPHISLNSLNSAKIGTSEIRDFLASGNIAAANNLLGQPFLIRGVVRRGRQLGRTMGYPTANLYPSSDKFLPPNGVYSAKITVDGIVKNGVTNIGLNPTVAVDRNYKVETHIFDFDADIYDRIILVELLDFIRNEQVFGSVEELKRQIALDAGAVRG